VAYEKFYKEIDEWAESATNEIEFKPFPEKDDKLWDWSLSLRVMMVRSNYTNYARLLKKGFDMFVKKYPNLKLNKDFEIYEPVRDAFEKLVDKKIAEVLKKRA
jgi:hypothetical protein